jgi:photosystem II stability/assembly factor-like uncharacterized protein
VANKQTNKTTDQSALSLTSAEHVEGQAKSPAYLNALEWRLAGPHRGGRVVAVAGDPHNRQVFYFGSTGGGVWKTTDGGVYWENVSDGFFKRASVGALAVAPSDPNVIYAGMGESTIRGNVSHGDGVYKSTDAGKTWTHLGLEDTRNIAKVRVHPQNPDVVYVAALGHAHGPNETRGVYRSRDGGKTWERVLFRSATAGASDLSMDPNNPRILYAALWEAVRKPHQLVSGGEGTSLWKSTDGGDTWTDITRNKGLPKGTLGKIGVVVSPARTDRVWAIIDAEDGAVFRSDDGGETWQKLSEQREPRGRPWYYLHIHADPQDADTVWVLNTRLWRSIDGGKTFAEMAVPHGDNHDMWFDPQDSRRIIEGNDGGATITFNGAETWSSLYNQPTAEFYHVITDNQVPYRIYGAQQDNTTISVPSRSRFAAISRVDYEEIGGGESGYIAVRPDDPNIIYAGSYLGYLTRYDSRTSQRRDISVWPEWTMGYPAKDAKYRFQWTFPVVLSPHDANVLYATGNQVFRSTDEGTSWEAISPDLTRHDVQTLGPSGGPVTEDNVGTEYYATVFAFDESKRQRGLFWAGSDDGLVHVSRDGGATWEDVTPTELPKLALVSIIEPSPHDPASAYLAATAYKSDDFAPYFFKTNDYGKTWTKITDGIPANEFSRVIREDPKRRGLLFAGTEAGIYVSFDDGGHWLPLQRNLPAVPIHDLVVKDDDLIVATHGRSFWVLDDITPLRQLSDELLAEPAHLFSVPPTIRYWTDYGFGGSSVPGRNYGFSGTQILGYKVRELPNGEKLSVYLDAGQNPRDGVYVSYFLREKPDGEVKLTFLDAAGNEIKSFSSEEKDEKAEKSGQPAAATGEKKKDEKKKEPRVPKEAGANRFFWNMRYPDAKAVEGFVASGGDLTGPAAAPGTYSVRLTMGDQSYTEPFEIRRDPRISASDEDLRAQFDLLIRIRDKVSEAHEAVNKIKSTRRQVEEWEKRAAGTPEHENLSAAAKALKEKLQPFEEALINPKIQDDEDTLRLPIRLNVQLATLSGVVSGADAAPTRQSYEVFDHLAGKVDQQIAQLNDVLRDDLEQFSGLIRGASVPAIVPRSEKES